MKRAAFVAVVLLLFVALVLPFLLPLPGGSGVEPAEAAQDGGRLVTAAGTTTFVREVGPASGPAVVLIHGFGGSTFSWRYTLPALADAGYHAVALDLRGFGLSEKQFEADHSHAAQAEFVAAVLDELGLERVVLVGHSMGGNVAAHVALRYPQRVARLALVDGAVVQEGQPARGGGLLGALIDFAPARRWMRIGGRLYYTEGRARAILNSAVADPASVTPEMVAGYHDVSQVRDWDLALLAIMRDAGHNALPQPLSAIEAPTLLIWGAEDTWVPLPAGEALHEALPGSQLVVLPAAGHLPMEEEPAPFNEALLEFLAAP